MYVVLNFQNNNKDDPASEIIIDWIKELVADKSKKNESPLKFAVSVDVVDKWEEITSAKK